MEATRPRFVNYPEPCKGPDVVLKKRETRNPVISGRILVVAAFLMEWVRIIREVAWKNAGFASIRQIRGFLEDYEPRYSPAVIPASIREAQAQPTDAKPDPSLESNGFTYPALNSKYYSVADYRALFLSGEITPTDVARTILRLIRRDPLSPSKHSNAWIDVKEDLVLRAAEASTQRYKENRSLGPLDGVPSAVKDDYDLDGYASTLGSINDYSTKNSPDGSITSWPIRKLEGVGVVFIGKLSMHEFGMDTSGINLHYGTPLNPFNPKYYTGGSSSGPAYAVATGLIPFALGSDGGGSVRIPASFCSVFGLKPTHDRIAMYPGVNHAPTCAVVGPLAADMRSLATLYKVFAEPHPSTQYPPLNLQPSRPLTKLLGIDEGWFSYATPASQTLIRGLLDVLCSKHGYQIVPINIPFVEEGQIAHALTILTDAATLLPKTDGITAANKIFLALGRTTPATDYLLAQKLRGLLMQHLAHLWRTYPGMLIITPTTACAGAPIRGGAAELKYGASDGNLTIDTMRFVWMANYCGLPALTAPAGYVVPEGEPNAGEIAHSGTAGKIPVGLMAMGEWCTEENLLEFGLDVEAAGEERRARPHETWEDVIGKTRRQY